MRKNHKNNLRRELKKMNINQLHKTLQDMETRKLKFMNHLRDKKGGYPSQPDPSWRHGNYKLLCKDIARVKTELHMRTGWG